MKRLPLLVPLLSLGCSLASESPGPPPLLTGLPRDLTTSEAALVQSGNRFGLALFQRVRAGAPDSNVFLSPASAAMALGMTLNGAAGPTFDSMRAALRAGGLGQAEINAGFRSVIDLLRGLDPTTEFRIANSIWAQSGVPWKPEFLNAGRTAFDAEIRSLNLQAPEAVTTINDWVSSSTNGKIPTIISQIQSNEVMFLINAIYFKGRWRAGFDPDRTQPGTFHGVGGTQTVPMMSRDPDTLRYGRVGDVEIVDLLYGNGAWAMTIVLPGPGAPLGTVAAGLDEAGWSQWIGGLQTAKVGLVLPRFRLEYKRELKDDLSALGMRLAFDPDQADFSGMAPPGSVSGRLYLTRVTQKTFVDVNEQGTEAAAATSVGVGVTSAPPMVVVNRPFLFAIRERLSGTILFLGQITRIP